MQQRQPRLGDILDDYCPRERRVTNHAVVAMVGAEVKQTRCTTCEAEHEFRHAKVPRARRKADTPAALYAQVLAGAPKRVAHEPAESESPAPAAAAPPNGGDERAAAQPASLEGAETAASARAVGEAQEPEEAERDAEQGPAHRRLIRATLPRPEGQPPPVRPVPEFTIRQPNPRHGRFRPRHQRSASFPGGHRSGAAGGGMSRHSGGRPPMAPGQQRHGPGGRKRSK